MMDFKRRVEALRSLGYQLEFEAAQDERGFVRDEHGVVRLERIASVRLPFSAEEWVSIVQRNGIHNMADFEPEVQQILFEAFREEGGITGPSLRRISELFLEWEVHPVEGDDTPWVLFTTPTNLEDMVSEAKSHWRSLQPIDKVALAWHLVDGHYVPSEKDTPAVVHETPHEEALRVISHSAFMLYMGPLFDKGTDQDLVNRTMDVYRMAPALRMILDRIKEFTPEPLTGFVLVDGAKGPEAVASNGGGYCFYRTRPEAEAAFKGALDAAKDRSELARFGIRQARASADKGFEFLDSGPGPII